MGETALPAARGSRVAAPRRSWPPGAPTVTSHWFHAASDASVHVCLVVSLVACTSRPQRGSGRRQQGRNRESGGLP
jgi:hypothetical protein